jgi:hypothetical protein
MRTPCLVPFCNRTRKLIEGPGFEWICAKHWAVLPQARRKAYHRARRHYKMSGKGIDAVRCARLWRVLRKQAMKMAMEDGDAG